MSRDIPFEIQRELMLRLPVQSLVSFRRVSRRWRNTINGGRFRRAYGARQTNICSLLMVCKHITEGYMYKVNANLTFNPFGLRLNINDLKPVGNSEGIWCFSYANDYALVLFNPSVNKLVMILTPDFVNQPDSPKRLYGFGVNPVTLDPTMLKINYPMYEQGPWYVAVRSRSMGSRGWLILDSHVLPRQSIRLKRSGQAVINGIIYWVASEKIYYTKNDWWKEYMLVSFDLVSRQFQVIDIPNVVRSRIKAPYYIVPLKNNLVVSGSNTTEYGDPELANDFSAWALTIEGGMVSSLTPLFTIQMPINLRVKLVGFTSLDLPIVEITEHPQLFTNILHVWNPITLTFQAMPGIHGNWGSFCTGIYKESLMFLNEPQNVVYS